MTAPTCRVVSRSQLQCLSSVQHAFEIAAKFISRWGLLTPNRPQYAKYMLSLDLFGLQTSHNRESVSLHNREPTFAAAFGKVLAMASVIVQR
ncbi:hypothetical protein D3C80_1265400 [compost metagenome]